MRILPVAILLVVIILFSSIVCYHALSRCKYRKTLRLIIVVLDMILFSAFAVALASLAMNLDIVPVKMMFWLNWVIFTIYGPMLSYSLFYSLGLLASYVFGKAVVVGRRFGLVMALVTFFVMLTGMFTRHSVEVKEVELEFPNLPNGFDGMRIVHITDLHLGCLSPEDSYVAKVEKKIVELDPDLLVFTGDLFNLSVEEGAGHEDIFRTVDPELGKLMVLGNHDYGVYAGLTGDDLQDNVVRTREFVETLGFDLLCDSSLYLERGGDTINVVGIEYCGNDMFPCYSDIEKVKPLFEEERFNIFLAHDPEYWRINVPIEVPYADLTLSGHTHSGQFGVECGDFKMSPSSLIYPHWDGHYSKGEVRNLHLYVSRGLGYVGLPFRFGMKPEITVLTLRRE